MAALFMPGGLFLCRDAFNGRGFPYHPQVMINNAIGVSVEPH